MTGGVRHGRSRSLRRALLTGLLGTLSIAVLGTPFAVAWHYEGHRQGAVSAQAPPPAGPDDARPGPVPSGPAAAPVVLAYHDIAPHSESRFAVAPERFAAQLTALRAAGYRTLSTGEFTDFLATGRAPGPRTVYLTFDDGTRGLWAYADPILADHRMTAAAYLVTGSVGTHRPYYLSWPEVRRMADSGRWDFQDHTHRSHRRAPVDAAGRLGSVLAHRLWLPGPRRPETPAEYRQRVRRDLRQSLAAFRDHGLPAPRLFAYPFSESAERHNEVLRQLLREHFTAVLTNTASPALPPGRRAAAAGEVQRLEVLRGTTPQELLRRIGSWRTAVPGDVRDPLGHEELWESRDGAPGTRLDTLTGRGPRRGTYAAASYRPVATADWRTYRVEVTADRLDGTRDSVSVTVRDGSAYPCVLTVGARTARLTERLPGAPARTTVRRLGPAGIHRVRLEVSPAAVTVTVDGTPAFTRPVTSREAGRTAGGVALAVRNEDPEQPWPRVAALRILP
ncbi:polysaccharide deacetylase family protein [Streptomyces sp. NPDC056160]|uniref:polysaccharide deacetylase family protein n=1 Tax=Streptomyces sp. NPDC056160 TaxID=3345731 RepID=UPI0035DB4A21